MALKDIINNDLKAALLGGDRFLSEVLRELKAAVLNEEISTGSRDEGLSDPDIERLIAREVKKRNESATVYASAGRSELAEKEKAEAELLSKYLPEQLSEAEILQIIHEVIIDQKAESPSMIGQVIGAVKSKIGNTADGALIARLVKESLNKN